ncbi:MAG TPA: PIN domain-containing protein [Terriglobales bacterium]
MKPVLLDTGVIVALLDPTDRLHQRCADAIAAVEGPLLTCEPVITESCHLLRRVEGAAGAILESVQTGEFEIPEGLSAAAAPVRRILERFRDQDIDLADAFLIHMADEFDTGQILTVDRNFFVYRWGKNNPFEVLVRLEF